MQDYLHTTRRATTGRNALSVLAGVFLCASCLFWGVLHWQVFVASYRDIPQIVVALVMTVIYAFALPLLLSMLVPTTPAGQMLQKTQWKTIGFPVIIACAAFLAWHARTLMLSWFLVQPAVAGAGLQGAYTIAALIGFVVIPALAWVQVTPERWLAEIQQAHLVKKLDLEQRGELAIIKARLLWAEQKAAIGYAKLLPNEQQEVHDTLKGLLMGIADTQRSIARTLGIQGDLERSIMGDQEIADTLYYVEQQLAKPAASIDRAVASFDKAQIDQLNRENASTVRWLEGQPPVDQASQSLEPRRASAAPRRAAPRYAAEYATANQALTRFFTVRQVGELLGNAPERTARDVVDAWHAQGWIEPGNIRGQWRFSDHNEVQK